MQLCSKMIGAAFSFALCFGCDLYQPPASTPTSEMSELEVDVASLLAHESDIVRRAPKNSTNQLAFDLYRQLQGVDNVTYSPFSISLALAMTYAGSKGDTEAAMKNALHFGDNTEEFHKSYGQFANLMSNKDRTEREAELKISNHQWLQKDFEIFKEYTDLLATSYVAKPTLLDFENASSDATKTINQTVAEQTKNEIPQLLKKDLSKDTRFVLTNAMYFNAKWDESFSKYATAEGDFAAKGGARVSVKYMKQNRRYPYAEDQDKQILLLPYRDDDFAAIFILPKEGKLNSVEQTQSAAEFDRLVDSLERRKVDIWLPKFSQTTAPQMKEALTNLGLGIIFDDLKADFSRINGVTAFGDKKLYISDVAHEAVVKMYESGTTAAAATAAIGARATSIPVEEEPVVFHAERPFFFYIIHRESKTILFMGRVDSPVAPSEE